MIASKPRIYSDVSDVILSDRIKTSIKESLRKNRPSDILNYNDLKELAGSLLNYEVEILNIENCGGACDIYSKRILLRSDYTLKENQLVLCHELGHAIQEKTGHYDNYNCLLSSLIQEEQQAEKIGLTLFQSLFPHTPVKKEDFGGYFESDAIDFLSKYYEGFCINDLGND